MIQIIWFGTLILLLSACGNNQDAGVAALPENAVNTTTSAPLAIDGQAIYIERCQACHEGRVAKAPPVSLLGIMTVSSIVKAMDGGIMSTQAAGLSAQQRIAVAEHLTGQRANASVLPPLMCAADASPFDFGAPADAQGWGNDLQNTRHVPVAQGGLVAADLPELKLAWAFAFPEAIRARSQPATAGGALFVGSHNGTVYALDQKTGCVRWAYQNNAEVRTSFVIEPWADGGDNPLMYFGDLLGYVHAVDAVTGEQRWKRRASDHPSLTLTATPVLFEGKLFVPMSSLEVTAAADPNYACCTFRGGIAVYQGDTGEALWTTHTIAEPGQQVAKNPVGTPIISPSGAPIWGTPSIDLKRRSIYVGTGENYSSPADDSSDAIIAFDLDSGKIRWKRQATADDAWNMACESENQANCPAEDGPDYDFGAATILATSSAGQDVLLAGQKSGDVFGINPDNGEILWQNKVGRGGIQGGVHFGMAVSGDTLFVPISDFEGGDRWPGVPKPGMYALDISSGKLLWTTPAVDVCEGREFCQPGLSAAATAIPGAVVAGSMDGHLRAYDSASGEIIWDFDSAVEFDTLSGERARGGSFGGSTGPVFKDGMMFVNSGYGIYFHMPGNVLLAFSKAP